MVKSRIESYLRAIETDTVDEYHDYQDRWKKNHKKHGETGLKSGRESASAIFF
jgi:hypothetical protein